jgi:hypothetical protein
MKAVFSLMQPRRVRGIPIGLLAGASVVFNEQGTMICRLCSRRREAVGVVVAALCGAEAAAAAATAVEMHRQLWAVVAGVPALCGAEAAAAEIHRQLWADAAVAATATVAAR